LALGAARAPRAHAAPTGPGVGQTARYSLSVRVIVREDSADATETAALIQTAHVTLEPIAQEDDGGLIVRGRFDRLTAVWRRGDEQLEFIWPRDDAPALGAAPEAPIVDEALSPSEAFAAVFEATAAQPFELIVSADGQVVSVRGLTAEARAQASGMVDPAAVGMLRPARFAAIVQPIFDAGGLPMGRLAPWTRTRVEPMGAAGAVTIVTAWRPVEGEEGRVEAEASATITVAPRDPASDGQPVFELTRAEGEGALVWSAQAGLQAWSETLVIGGRWSVGDIQARLSVRSERAVRRIED